MLGRVDGAEAVGQDCAGGYAGFDGRTVGTDVDAVGQSAHDYHLVEHLGEVAYKPLGKLCPVVGAVACAYYRYHVGRVVTGIAEGKQHCRGVVALRQARGVVVIAGEYCLYVVGGHKVALPSGRLKSLLPPGVVEEYFSQSGDSRQFPRIVFEKVARAYAQVVKTSGSAYCDIAVRGKGNIICQGVAAGHGGHESLRYLPKASARRSPRERRPFSNDAISTTARMTGWPSGLNMS